MPDKDTMPDKVFYRTLPHLTWAQLADKISQMTQQEREEAVTVQHDGLDYTYNVSLESRDDGPCYPDGRKLYPFNQLHCEEEVLMDEDRFANSGISEYAEKIVVIDNKRDDKAVSAQCPDCKMPTRFCTCNWDQEEVTR